MPPPAVTVNYGAGLPESPRNSSKDGQMVTLVSHEFDLGWAGLVLQVMLSFGEREKKLVLGNCPCESGDVNPKSWINFQLHCPGIENTHMSLDWGFYFSTENTSGESPRIPVVQNLALGGMDLACNVCTSTHIKQFIIKYVGTTRYHQHFVSRMSLLDWNWWMSNIVVSLFLERCRLCSLPTLNLIFP